MGRPAGSKSVGRPRGPAGAKEPVLYCPYTGESLVPEYNDKLKAHYCSGGFDPTELGATQEELEAKFRQRPGRGQIPGPLRCAYLGTPVEIVWVAVGKWQARGTFFTPRSFFEDKQELLYAVSARNGVEPAFPKKHVIQVREVEPPELSPIEDTTVATEIGNEVAEALLGG